MFDSGRWGQTTAGGGGGTAARLAVDDRAPGLAGAVEGLAAALDVLADADPNLEDDRALLDAAVALQRAADRLAGAQLRVLERIDRREAHVLEGAVTTASWLRGRTRLDHATAARQVTAACRPACPASTPRWTPARSPSATW